MEADATPFPNPAPAPEQAPQKDSSAVRSSSSEASPAATAAPPEARKVAAAMEAVERDAAAIAESYASLFASLRLALSNVTSTSAENMECLGEVVGRLQESGEDVEKSTKISARWKRLLKEISTSIRA